MGPEDLSVSLKNSETYKLADLEPSKNESSLRLKRLSLVGNSPSLEVYKQRPDDISESGLAKALHSDILTPQQDLPSEYTPFTGQFVYNIGEGIYF